MVELFSEMKIESSGSQSQQHVNIPEKLVEVVDAWSDSRPIGPESLQWGWTLVFFFPRDTHM